MIAGVDLVHELKSVTAALDQAGVAYALCGALALAVHGVARHTSDIDLLVEASSVEAAIAAASRCGFTLGALPMGFSDGVELHRRSKIVDGEVLTLDLMVVSPVYDEVWRTRERLPTDDGHLVVVSRAGLIQMKLTAARPKDVEDVARLEELDR